VLDELNHLAIEFVSFRENLDTAARSAGPSSSSSGLSLNSNGTSLSSGCEQVCAGPGSKAGISVAGHSISIGLLFFGIELVFKASARSQRPSAYRGPRSAV
jgi:hypothetical protein